jgi:hypothetical protein
MESAQRPTQIPLPFKQGELPFGIQGDVRNFHDHAGLAISLRYRNKTLLKGALFAKQHKAGVDCNTRQPR